MQRLSALDSEDPTAKDYIDEARRILTHADSIAAYDLADRLLAGAEASELRSIEAAEALEREAHDAARGKGRSAASTRAERGELSLTRL